MAGVRTETVPEELAGQRIDNYLLRVLKGVPKTRIYRLLRRGEVRVNGGRARPATRLSAGDRVRIPPVREATGGEPMKPSAQIMRRLEAAIIHEDERILVVDKPSGLAVHGGSGIAYGVVEALRLMRPQARFLDLAHRLDRETSGCLVLAKRRSSLRALHAEFREGRVDKRYLALVHGRFSDGTRRVEAPLRPEAGKGGERLMRVHPEGVSARTDFRCLRSYGSWSLVEAILHTGRMHQIRAHAASIGHPVAMDHRYGSRVADQEIRPLGLRRLFLHASSLGFEAPHCGRIEVETPLPDELAKLLERLADD
ncbi:RluA family pseudouridine synthase [Spiribacter insolitus]|uniref:Pseudouridine synthase n=1 Tax=Spiribacter insolitus TaxID=3122417 RepID=A0ABV3T5T0_9GAMM